MIESFLTSCSVVDVESTSPDPATCEVIELAFSLYNGDWNCLTNHYKPSIPIPAASSEKHFINDSMVADKPSFASVADGGFLTVADACEYFVAHNAKYDKTAILNNMRMYGIQAPAKVASEDHWICTYKLAKKLLANDPKIEAHRLGYLWFELGLWKTCTRPIIPHQADSDIYMAGKLFEYLLDIMIQRGLVDTSYDIGKQIIAFQNEPIILKTWPFGKHKGVPVADVPSDYLQWAVLNLSSLNEEHADYDIDLAATVMSLFE